MKINWLVRIKNKTFWMTMIPAVLMLVTSILAVFGVEINLSWLSDKLLAVVTAVFTVLAIAGIVVDPTTNGVGDSQRALGYSEPWKDEEDTEG